MRMHTLFLLQIEEKENNSVDSEEGEEAEMELLDDEAEAEELLDGFKDLDVVANFRDWYAGHAELVAATAKRTANVAFERAFNPSA